MFPLSFLLTLSASLIFFTPAAGETPDRSSAVAFESHFDHRLDPESEGYSSSSQHGFARPAEHGRIHRIPTLTVKTRPTMVHRPRSREALQRARLRSLRAQQSEAVEWVPTEIQGPDIEDRHTIIQLARMAGDAYALPGRSNWYDVDPAWNKVSKLSISPSLLL